MTLSDHDIITARHIHALITSDLKTHYTLAGLSLRFHINTTTLEQAFTLLYGKPVHQYLIDYRMLQACAMLQDHNNKIEVIAIRLGYAGKASFTKAFRLHYGVPPSQYRRK
jgi:AraC-like DNA-binding protein